MNKLVFSTHALLNLITLPCVMIISLLLFACSSASNDTLSHQQSTKSATTTTQAAINNSNDNKQANVSNNNQASGLDSINGNSQPQLIGGFAVVFFTRYDQKKIDDIAKLALAGRLQQIKITYPKNEELLATVIMKQLNSYIAGAQDNSIHANQHVHMACKRSGAKNSSNKYQHNHKHCNKHHCKYNKGVNVGPCRWQEYNSQPVIGESGVTSNPQSMAQTKQRDQAYGSNKPSITLEEVDLVNTRLTQYRHDQVVATIYFHKNN